MLVYSAYMEPRLVEEDVVLLVIHLQELACLFRTLGTETLDVKLRLLRSSKVNFRSCRHVC